MSRNVIDGTQDHQTVLFSESIGQSIYSVKESRLSLFEYQLHLVHISNNKKYIQQLF